MLERRFFLFLLPALLLMFPARAEEPLRITSSIKPVHSLLAALTEGVARPELLVKGAASPHGFALKPSEARMIAASDLLFWVGPSLEGFLKKPVAGLGAKRAIALQDLPGMKLREGGGDGHDHDHKHGDKHEIDGHLWLDVGNMRVFLKEAARLIVLHRPASAARIAANLEKLEADMAALDAELMAALAPLKGKPYVVFHDAYGYFEERYGLKPLGVVTVNPEKRPGAKKLADLRRRIEKSGAACIFREPQFDAAFAATLAEGTRARIGTLDPLGAELADGPELYFQLMRNLAAGFAACL